MGAKVTKPDAARDAEGLLSQMMAEYLRECANRMELRDWTLNVSVAESDRPDDVEERNASTQFTYGRRHAFIWFNSTYVLNASPRDLRQTTAHELVHLHLEAQREVALNAIVTAYKKAARHALLGIYDMASEQGVEALAWVVAPTLPYPPAAITGVAADDA